MSFQDLLKTVAKLLQIPLEEVQEALHKLLDILCSSGLSSVVIPINKILEPTRIFCQTPATIPLYPRG